MKRFDPPVLWPGKLHMMYGYPYVIVVLSICDGTVYTYAARELKIFALEHRNALPLDAGWECIA